jgi:UDP-N-acetylglucosamine enolpyruvyl transferase
MDAIRIRGARKLEGRIAVSAAKNAALPNGCAAWPLRGVVDHHDRGHRALEKKLAQVGADSARINLADEDR